MRKPDHQTVRRVVLGSALLAAVSALLPGCDALFPEDHSLTVTGQVLEAGTAAPIPGVGVYLVKKYRIAIVVAEARTGADGRFRITHDDGPDPSSFPLYINNRPGFGDGYDPTYTVQVRHVLKGQTTDLGVIELRRNPTE